MRSASAGQAWPGRPGADGAVTVGSMMERIRGTRRRCRAIADPTRSAGMDSAVPSIAISSSDPAVGSAATSGCWKPGLRVLLSTFDMGLPAPRRDGLRDPCEHPLDEHGTARAETASDVRLGDDSAQSVIPRDDGDATNLL